ncbi:MAG: hypothetical protein HY011_08715 [Acidobacteria bacterium]|nr:hypothetical protein [Acidobacteriota bacterium]
MSNEHDDTKDLTEKLSERELLLMIVRRLGTLETRFDGLEARFEGCDTNPLLPPNFVETFQTLASDVHDMRNDLRVMCEDIDRERRNRVEIAQRLDTLERRAA